MTAAAAICAVALCASAFTFLSGFGLGTLLLPAFAMFFPIDQAVAMTAVVHLCNNLFKVGLIGRHASVEVALRFGVPAAAAAAGGAWLLGALSGLEPIARYQLLGGERRVLPGQLVVAALMVAFAAFELVPRLAAIQLSRRWLPLGGLLSGFFGGLSGHQGALRSAFLLKAGLSKEGFVGTGVLIAVAVDLVRLSVYGAGATGRAIAGHGPLVAAAVLAAFAGAAGGRLLLAKVTFRAVQDLVGALLLLVAVLLGAGLI